MVLEFLGDLTYPPPGIVNGDVAPVQGVEQSEQRDLFSLRSQLLRHLVRDRAAHTVPAKIIRSARLKATEILHVTSGHLLNGLQIRKFSIQTLSLQSIKRLVGAKMF